MKKNIKKNIFAYFIILTIICNTINSYASDIIYSNPDKTILGPLYIPYTKMIVTGDSYAGLFCTFEDNKDFKLKGHAIAGRTIVDNEGIMCEALHDSNFKLALICIGVNDHYQITPPYRFEATLRRILNYGLMTDKCVFISSYCNYPIAEMCNNIYPTYKYDNIIRGLTSIYPNLHYIDMSDCANDKYIAKDNIHYNKEFYDIMYNRMTDIIRTIDF